MAPQPPPSSEPDLLAPDVLIDLTNCEREPIHVPGSVQPRGMMLVVDEPSPVVLQVSENVTEVLGLATGQVLGQPLEAVLGDEAAAEVRRHTETFSDLRERNPLLLTVDTAQGREDMDGVLHRVALDGVAGSVLLLELETARGPRPFSFPNTYHAVRAAVGALNRAASLAGLFEVTAREVRALTGFDRVMLYRFDAEYNGEVVAEARRDDLNSFLGLHYPASDIPAQARRLYERNLIRLISDVDYTPARLVPTLHPRTHRPIDLTDSVLRSVSPIHVEYLKNMGVRASMSISLLQDGRLWGLIACHHYSGPHAPPFGIRAAAEFLGSALSLRLIDRAADEELQAALHSRSTLAELVGASQDDDRSLRSSLLGRPGLLDLVPADGVVLRLEGGVSSAGAVPADDAVLAIVDWLGERTAEVVETDHLARLAPELAAQVPGVAGLLGLQLPEGQAVVWLRNETVQRVDWGGDPVNKAIVRTEGDEVRLSPRKSFDRWRELIRDRSEPWSPDQVGVTHALRHHLLEILYSRDRRRIQATETVQRSLLPRRLPQPDGWSVDALYQPAVGGMVGGDWYDAVELGDGRLALVMGDVAGHGIEAAGTMSELRNGLRAYLLQGDGPAEALAALDRLVDRVLPGEMATVVVAIAHLGTGALEWANAGHLPPVLLHADGTLEQLDDEPDLPLGVVPGSLVTRRATMQPGTTLVLVTDGVVERRDEGIDIGLERLRSTLAACSPGAGSLDLGVVLGAVRAEKSFDDATLLAVRRGGH